MFTFCVSLLTENSSYLIVLKKYVLNIRNISDEVTSIENNFVLTGIEACINVLVCMDIINFILRKSN